MSSFLGHTLVLGRVGSPQYKAKSLLLRWWGLPTLRLFQLILLEVINI